MSKTIIFKESFESRLELLKRSKQLTKRKRLKL